MSQIHRVTLALPVFYAASVLFSSRCYNLEIQIFFSLLKASLAFDNLFFKSFIPPPSLQTLTPKYTNSSTSSISCPLIMIFSWFLELILITFVFSLLILSPTHLASSSSLVVLSRICCLVGIVHYLWG